MLKVLIVDDEPWQVKTLASIIKSMKTGYEVFEASDGNEALGFLASNSIDVLITDIRMPVMDGLKLIEKVAGSEQKPEIVILSGYGEFQYAQKAINFGVSEYLLKPVSKTDIEGILNRLEEKLEQKKSEQNHKIGMIKKLENTLPVYIDHQLNGWISNELDPGGIEEILDIFPYKQNIAVIATKIRKYKRTAAMYNSEEFKSLQQHFKFMMKEVLNPIGHSISFFSEKNPEVMITILTSGNDFNLQSDRNERILKGFIDSIRNEFGLALVIGTGNKSSDMLNDLKKCYEQAAEALEYSFISGNRDICHFSGISYEKGRERLDIYSFEEELSAITLKAADEMTVKAISDVFDRYIGTHNSIKPQKLKEYLHHIAINLVKVAKNILVDEHYDVLVESIRDDIFESDSYKELKYVFIDIIGKLAGFMNNKENSSNYAVIRKCKKYIDENHALDISLESVANKFHFSHSYFSNIFKSYAGTGFSEYLMAVRIQKAQHLLKSTDYKVYDISEKVGYKDSAYFNRIFKREVGISPYKYRQVSSNL